MLAVTATMNGQDLARFRACLFDNANEDVYLNQPNIGVVGAYQELYKRNSDQTFIAFLHNDLSIYSDDWAARARSEFEDPEVGVIGFGGARFHGARHLYKVPYRLEDLARHEYYSNTEDWRTHGQHLTEPMDVAVLDGFALIVRRELLDKCNGWDPENWPPHHVYDYRICAEAHRHGYRCRAIPVRCLHHGGQTAVSAAYQEWCKTTKWGSDDYMHKEGHRLFYESYRDVMPWGWPRL